MLAALFSEASEPRDTVRCVPCLSCHSPSAVKQLLLVLLEVFHLYDY